MSLQNDAADRALRDAQSLLARGDMAGARQRCEAIVRVHPRSGIAHELFAIVEYQRGIYDHALALIDRAISIEPRNADFLNSRGIILQMLGRLDDALASFDASLSIEPRRAQVWYNRGIVLNATRRFDEALASYAKALEAQPNYPEALVNRGNVLQGLKRFDEALACYNGALAKNPNLPNALVNRGIALQALNRRVEALASFDRALASHPHYADALLNRGIALESLGRPEEALASYETAQRLEPRSKAILLKRGDVLQDLGRVDEAINAYRSVIATPIATNDDAALHDRVAVELLWCERKVCAWDALRHDTDEAARSLRAGTATPNPFVSLLVFDDPEIQLDCARRYSNDRRRGSLISVAKKPSMTDRIRVGYLSGDLGDHATSYLLAGVFEAHDRSRFEIRAYSYGPDDHSALRSRLLRSFDAFVDVRALSDIELAERIAADQVQILIDLNGYTRQNRTSVFEFRPAPICVHYLGYPGTLGSQDVDYLIADS